MMCNTKSLLHVIYIMIMYIYCKNKNDLSNKYLINNQMLKSEFFTYDWSIDESEEQVTSNALISSASFLFL